MNFRQSVPLVLGLVVVGVGAAALVHPQGLSGALGLASESTADESTAPADEAAPKVGGNHATELQKADAAYDQGDFDGSITFYMTASALASDTAGRARATRGLHRAVLALCLVRDAPAPDAAVGAPAEHFAELRERAELSGDEATWFEALRFAAGAGLAEELPSVVRPCLDAARAGGPVEQHLMACLGTMGRREKTFRLAMIEKGLGGEAVRRSMTSGGTAPVAYEADDDDEPSGIGGSSSRHIPFGTFSKATRAALRRGVELEEKGLQEYELAGPDGTDRAQHRKLAYRYLREVRDIYDAAIEEDPDSTELQQRHRRVRMALAQISKERGIDEF